MKKLCVFASGAGSNAENLIRYFKERKTADVALVVTSRKDAGVVELAKGLGVEVLVCDRESFNNPSGLTQKLQEKEIEFIVLAGFLWLIPECMVKAFPGKIVNIHPALLPRYGGKGMFGMHVHEAVVKAGEKESGITIHYVNNRYDEGQILLQKKFSLEPEETPNSLALKIRSLEHQYLPPLVESLII